MSTEPVVILFPDEIAAWLASAPPATCPICRESFSDRDITTCDECGTTLCVHCGDTRDSEDYVCPHCHAVYTRERETEERTIALALIADATPPDPDTLRREAARYTVARDVRRGL
jgi:hypothetical protein